MNSRNWPISQKGLHSVGSVSSGLLSDPVNPPVDSPEYPPELARLPPGRHGLPREFVSHNQRERLIAGLAEAESIEELLPEIVEFALTPYLGAEAAREVVGAGRTGLEPSDD